MTREWAVGGTVVVMFPLSPRFEQVDDAQPSFSSFGTLSHGLLLLAVLTTKGMLFISNCTIEQVIRRTSTVALGFDRGHQCGGLWWRTTPSGDMLPLNMPREEHVRALCQVYFHTSTWLGRTIPAGTAAVTIADVPSTSSSRAAR